MLAVFLTRLGIEEQETDPFALFGRGGSFRWSLTAVSDSGRIRPSNPVNARLAPFTAISQRQGQSARLADTLLQ